MTPEQTQQLTNFHSKGELIKEAHLLSGPSITGSVQVNLTELDQMRTDHARAVKLAKELEARQMQVKITVVNKKETPGFNKITGYDRWNNPQYERIAASTEYDQLDVHYLNLDDVRSEISRQEQMKTEEQVNHLAVQVSNFKEKVRGLEEERRNLGIELSSVRAEVENQKKLYKEIDKKAVDCSWN